jgi:hypothetical protein
MFNSLTHEDKDALQVDNTRDSEAYTKLINSKGIRGVHVNPFPDFERTFHRCWQIVHQEAVIEGFDWVFSVEADTIPAPESLALMLDICKRGNIQMLTHTYPMHLLDDGKNGNTSSRNPNRFVYNELGCCLMSTHALGLGLADNGRKPNFTECLFQAAAMYLLGWGTLTNAFEVKHLDGYHMEYTQFISHEEAADGRWCPISTEAIKDYGVDLPPSIAEDYKKMGHTVGNPVKEMAEGADSYEMKAEAHKV